MIKPELTPAQMVTSLAMGLTAVVSAEPSRARDLALIRLVMFAAEELGPDRAVPLFFTALSIIDLKERIGIDMLDNDSIHELRKAILEGAEEELQDVYVKNENSPQMEELRNTMKILATIIDTPDTDVKVTEVEGFDLVQAGDQ